MYKKKIEPKLNPNGTINLTRENAEELVAMGWTGCQHWDCGCPPDAEENDHRVLEAYVKKYEQQS